MELTGERDAIERDAKARTILLTLNDDALTAVVLTKKLGLEDAEAVKLVKRLRKEIGTRAAVDRRAALGETIARLNEIYKTAIQAQDAKTALAVQKELNKTQCLYNQIEEKEAQKIDREKEETRRILESAVDGEYGKLDDLARVVVHKLIEAQTNSD